MNFLQIQRDIPDIQPDIVFDVLGFRIASSTMMIFLIIVLCAILSLYIVRRFKMRPGSFQALVEVAYEETLALIDQVTNSAKRSAKIFPIIASMFFYLIAANILGLIPGIENLSINGTPLLYTPTADFNTTFGLALAAIVVINVISIKEWGLFSHIGKFFKVREVVAGFKKSMGDGAMALVDAFVGLLDIIGEIAKIISLSVRLFANMYAGQILMIILFGAFAFLVPSIWYAMNVFVGLLQALVFAVLVASYYMLAVKPEEESS